MPPLFTHRVTGKRAITPPSPAQRVIEILFGAILSIKISLLRAANRNDEAAGIAEKLTLLNPSNTGALYTSAMILMSRGNLLRAINVLEELLSIDKNHINALRKITNLYYEKKIIPKPNPPPPSCSVFPPMTSKRKTSSTTSPPRESSKAASTTSGRRRNRYGYPRLIMVINGY
jgi:hypothetical protein